MDRKVSSEAVQAREQTLSLRELQEVLEWRRSVFAHWAFEMPSHERLQLRNVLDRRLGNQLIEAKQIDLEQNSPEDLFYL